MTFKDGVYYPLGTAEDMSEAQYQTSFAEDEGDLPNRPEEMSDAAYQAMCDEMVDEVSCCLSSLSEKPGYWLTKDKRVLKITEMETAHLRNAIRLFSAWSDHQKILELCVELAGRTT